MEYIKLNFLQDLVSRQIIFVEQTDNKSANKIALGLFNNEIFFDFVSSLSSGITALNEKRGWYTDPKDYLLIRMNYYLDKIKEKITECGVK